MTATVVNDDNTELTIKFQGNLLGQGNVVSRESVLITKIVIKITVRAAPSNGVLGQVITREAWPQAKLGE